MRQLARFTVFYLAFVSLSLHATEYRFVQIDVPHSDYTETNGVNARGDIVGMYVDSDGVSHSFVLRKGLFTTIDVPGATETLAARGINARGDIVGGFHDADFNRHGYLLSDGRFTRVDFPGATVTYMSGINNAGDVMGGYFDAQGNNATFLRQDGVFRVVNVPGGFMANVRSVQDNGRVMVGSVYLKRDGGARGFISAKPGEFKLIEYPGLSVPCTGVRSINQRGDLVGGFAYVDTVDQCFGSVSPDAEQHGFLLREGHFSRLDFPRSTGTDAFGINDDGVIVGRFIDQEGSTHGFKAVPRD